VAGNPSNQETTASSSIVLTRLTRRKTMVVPNMDPVAWVRKQLEEAEPDLLRAMVSAFADALMGAEVDAVCNAAYNERTPERANSRNG